MVQQGSSRKKVVRDTVHLDFLRKAMEWVVDASIFEDIRRMAIPNGSRKSW